MNIKILRSSIVGEIKRQFSSDYPFLKLEFLMPQRLPTGGKHLVITNANSRLGDIQPRMREGAIVVNNKTTVGELEKFFSNHLLDVQVFRRSENLWLETTMTDGWTLENQNSHGKEISEFKHISNKRNYFNDIANDAL
jgi:hypothetical protein